MAFPIRGKPLLNYLRSTFRLSGLATNPLEGPCGDQAHNQEVVTAETGGILPVFSVFVGALKRDVEHGAFFGFLPPDAGAHSAMADFVDRLAIGCVRCFIIHDVFVVID